PEAAGGGGCRVRHGWHWASLPQRGVGGWPLPVLPAVPAVAERGVGAGGAGTGEGGSGNTPVRTMRIFSTLSAWTSRPTGAFEEVGIQKASHEAVLCGRCCS